MLKTYFNEKITLYGKEEIKNTCFKTENNFAIYEKVQQKMCVTCSKLIMSQFLSTLEGRKEVLGFSLLPENSISHVH